MRAVMLHKPKHNLWQNCKAKKKICQAMRKIHNIDYFSYLVSSFFNFFREDIVYITLTLHFMSHFGWLGL